jgi:hypothetical protein
MNISIITKICPKTYDVKKWQLVLGLFTNCKKMVSCCKCYMLVKGWKCLHRLYISRMGTVLTS